MAAAIKIATEAAEEAGMDASAAVQALEEAVAAGEDPTAAAQRCERFFPTEQVNANSLSSFAYSATENQIADRGPITTKPNASQ